MATSIPISWRRSTASRDSGRTASATAKRRQDSAGLEQEDGGLALRGALVREALQLRREARAGPAQQVRAAHHAARAPRPGAARRAPAIASNDVAGGIARPRSSAVRTMARATGCSESRSTAAASRSASSSAMPGAVATADHPVLAERERPGLVEDHRVEPPRLLEPAPVAHEQAGPRAQRRRDGDHERDREAERVRTGDHEHGDDPLDDEGPRRAQRDPDHRGDARPPRPPPG